MKGRRKTTKTAPATASNIIEGDPPTWMNPYAVETWHRTLGDIDRAGRTLDVLDLESFISYCTAAATVRQASETIDREGLTVSGGRDGTRKHPACSTMNAAASQVRQFAAELGLTAASRGRLPAPAPRLTTEPEWRANWRRTNPESFQRFITENGREPWAEFQEIEYL